MSTQKTERTYSFSEVPDHPLAQQYRVTERMAKRAYQAGRLHGAKPGLVVLFTASDIANWILGSRSDASADAK